MTPELSAAERELVADLISTASPLLTPYDHSTDECTTCKRTPKTCPGWFAPDPCGHRLAKRGTT